MPAALSQLQVLGALVGLRELKQPACALWSWLPHSPPRLVLCLCCAEPCVDVSVLAIKVLNKKVSR